MCPQVSGEVCRTREDFPTVPGEERGQKRKYVFNFMYLIVTANISLLHCLPAGVTLLALAEDGV